MAEVYLPGPNRIFYQSTNFVTGLTVTVDILEPPDLVCDPKIPLTDVGGGLYYFVYDFYKEGVWAGIFYEGSVKKKSQYWSIRKESSGFRASPGPSVINV